MKSNKTNIFGKYLVIGFIGLSTVFTACDDKVPQKKTEKPDDNTPANTIATKDIKEVVLRNYPGYFYNSYGVPTLYSIVKDYVAVLYERFDLMICIGYCDGLLYMLPCNRPDGNWIPFSNNNRRGDKFFFYDMGKITGLSEITSKKELPGSSYSCPTLFSITEKGGYEIVYKTDGSNMQYIRLWLKSYSEDNNGTIQSITVQYQLF